MGGGGPAGGGGGNRGACCKRGVTGEQETSSFGDCDFIKKNPEGPALSSIIEFIKSDSLWIITYVESWGVATTNNQSGLTAIGTGLGIQDFKEAMVKEEETEAAATCSADFGVCLYVPTIDFVGCFFTWISDLFACMG